MSVSYVPDDWKIVATDYTPANRSVSGYGGKIPTRYVINDRGRSWRKGRNRRVYAICYSNAASFYCISYGKRLFIQDRRFP